MSVRRKYPAHRPFRAPVSVAAVIAGSALALAACTADADDPTDGAPTGPGADETAQPQETPTDGGSDAWIDGLDLLAPVELTVAAGTDAGAAEGQSLDLREGWEAEVWANVPGARMAAWSPDGRLLVSSGDEGAVMQFTPGEPGQAPEEAALLDGLQNPQGLAFGESDSGTVLVVAEDTRLTRWDYADGEVSNPEVIRDDLPGGGHRSKFAVIRDDIVYYMVGSETNRDPVDRERTPERGTIARIGLDGTGDETIATGVRNGEGLSFAPDGTLWVAVNQGDNQPYPFDDGTGLYGSMDQDYVNENPVDQVWRVTEGGELGWPYCVPDIRDSEDATDVPFVNDPINNPDGDQLDCAALAPTDVGLPAHSAPIGFTFTQNSELPADLAAGALIGAHGSWNRNPPRPPYVAYSRWDDEAETLQAPVALITGFQNDDGSRWGRSVAAVPGPDGSIYVTDDMAGLVYRVTPAS